MQVPICDSGETRAPRSDEGGNGVYGEGLAATVVVVREAVAEGATAKAM